MVHQVLEVFDLVVCLCLGEEMVATEVLFALKLEGEGLPLVFGYLMRILALLVSKPSIHVDVVLVNSYQRVLVNVRD